MQTAHRILSISSLAVLAVLSLAQTASDPWPKSDLLEPAALVKALQSANPPTVICVAFPVLYRSRHITHSIYAGPGNKPEGLEMLKKAVANTPKDADLVIYCGCCPMAKCPNVRPAYRVLKEMGFARVRVLNLPTNTLTDWYNKDYPSEAGSAGAPR